MVLAIPSGGVQVGAAVAHALHAPLIPLLVRKVGLPEQPSVVVGAIDCDGAIVHGSVDPGLLPAEMESIAEDVGIQLNHWKDLFGSPDPAGLVRGRTVVVVDDALLSGLTMHAGLEFLRRRGAERILVAVPAASRDAAARIEGLGVELVAPERCPTAADIPAMYERLPEVTTEEMVDLLVRGGPSRPPALPAQNAVERAIRLVDAAGVSHSARLRLPSGLGPWPAVVVAGGGVEPGTPLGERVAARLSDAGVASLRVALGTAVPARLVLALAVDVLSARAEIEPLRLGVVGLSEAVEAATGFTSDRRVQALALASPPPDLEPPDLALGAGGRRSRRSRSGPAGALAGGAAAARLSPHGGFRLDRGRSKLAPQSPEARMRIGIIGSGQIGSAVAGLLTKAGHEVALSHRGGPASLKDKVAQLGPKARAATTEGAIDFGDLVVLAIPWRGRGELPADKLRGKIVIDATNQYRPDFTLADLAGSTSSEEMAKALPGARIVKAMNTLRAGELSSRGDTGKPLDSRTALLLAGDDEEASESSPASSRTSASAPSTPARSATEAWCSRPAGPSPGASCRAPRPAPRWRRPASAPPPTRSDQAWARGCVGAGSPWERNSSTSPWASPTITSPGLNSPRSSLSASGSITSRCRARLSGRAP